MTFAPRPILFDRLDPFTFFRASTSLALSLARILSWPPRTGRRSRYRPPSPPPPSTVPCRRLLHIAFVAPAGRSVSPIAASPRRRLDQPDTRSLPWLSVSAGSPPAPASCGPSPPPRCARIYPLIDFETDGSADLLSPRSAARCTWVSTPCRQPATPFRYSSLCSPSAYSTCYGAAANHRRSRAPADCVVSSSSAPVSTCCPSSIC